MEKQNRAAVPQDLPRMTLTQEEFERARGLVAKRPKTFSEAGVDLKGKLPWDNPDKLDKVDVPVVIKGVGDLATDARTTSTSELIQFLTRPSDYYNPESAVGAAIFGGRYVRAWLELEYRVSVFERKLIEDKEIAEKEKEIAERRAARAERRARIGTIIAIASLFIAAIALALRFFGRN